MKDRFAKFDNLWRYITACTPAHMWLVGGSVRDLIRRQPINDIDIAVDCTWAELKAIYDDFLADPGLCSHIAFYDSFGVLAFDYHDFHGTRETWRVELTMTRAESYRGKDRHPQVEHADLATDLARRDFTCNAIAYDPYTDTLIDPYNGARDIRDHMLRLIPGAYNTAFKQDPLRILRAYRFLQQLGFGMSPELGSCIHDHADELTWLSRERIKDELLKMARMPGFARSCYLMMVDNVWRYVLPGLEWLSKLEPGRKNMWDHTLRVVAAIEEITQDPILKLAALLHDIGKPIVAVCGAQGWTFHRHEQTGAELAGRLLRDLTFPAADVDRICRIVELHHLPLGLDDATPRALRRFVVTAGGVLDDLIRIAQCDYTTDNPDKQAACRRRITDLTDRIAALAVEDDYANFRLRLGGKRIIELLDIKPGPLVGAAKQYLTDLVFDGVVQNNTETLECLVIHLKEFLQNGKVCKDAG